MGKPTEQQLKHALKAAAAAREQGRDQHFVAKSLLHCHYENQYLREVFHAADAYLRSD